jgi:hypothetical protein
MNDNIQQPADGLGTRTRRILREGAASRLSIRRDGREVAGTRLTSGIAIAAVALVAAPGLTAVAAAAALLSGITVGIGTAGIATESDSLARRCARLRQPVSWRLRSSASWRAAMWTKRPSASV